MTEVHVDTLHLVAADGSPVAVHVFQSRIDTSDLSGQSAIGGLKAYRLPDGTHLNVDGDGFKNVKAGARFSPK